MANFNSNSSPEHFTQNFCGISFVERIGSSEESAMSIVGIAVGVAAIGASVGFAAAKTFEAISNKDLSAMGEVTTAATMSTLFSCGNLFTRALIIHRS